MKKEYIIGIEQIRYGEFKIEAETAEEALRIIGADYYNDAIELDKDKISDVYVRIIEPDDEYTDESMDISAFYPHCYENS